MTATGLLEADTPAGTAFLWVRAGGAKLVFRPLVVVADVDPPVSLAQERQDRSLRERLFG